jgi:hypothetical protein
MASRQDPIKSAALACAVGFALAACIFFGACGGGGDATDMPTPRVNCQQNPELCK